jgi:hypothetical protein
VRLFGISFANPSLEINAEVISFLIQLLFDQHAFISAAAVHFMIIWVLAYEMAVLSSIIDRITAAASIISSESALGHDEAMEARIRDANWSFRPFTDVLRKLSAAKIVRESDSMIGLGSPINSFGMNEERNGSMRRGRLLALGRFLLRIVEFKAVSMRILDMVPRDNNQDRAHGLCTRMAAVLLPTDLSCWSC